MCDFNFLVIGSGIYFLLALLIDKVISIIPIILIISGVGVVLFGFIIRVLLRIINCNTIVFAEGDIRYKGKKYLQETRYFKFQISLLDPSMTYPRLIISDGKQKKSFILQKKI